ncbi:MAG: helix-turn-helix transcriptional regulator [Cytophagales bacterium]|nr:helix-turn-helix transcriptional regulator [Cytophagales bacterium]
MTIILPNDRDKFLNKKTPVNYFSKNLKRLREENGYTQGAFATLLGLTRSNINSYESGNYPKLETFIRIMDHFNLDPSKFVNLDMEKASVQRSDQEGDGDRGAVIDLFFQGDLNKTDQFQYLDEYSEKDLKELLIESLLAKQILVKENMRLKELNIKTSSKNGDLSEKYIALLEQSKSED